jgi:GNAT superfamily N-acetyltransferase
MATTLDAPGTTDLDEALGVLRSWQEEGTPLQLHPGDLGWKARAGADAATAAVRAWRRGGEIVALGMLDAPNLLRLAVAPNAMQDDEVARQVVADLADETRGVLPAGEAYLEIPTDTLVRGVVLAGGWEPGESWTPLRRSLAVPVEEPGLRIEIAGPELAGVRTSVHRASFPKSTFTEDVWRTLASGPGYAGARCLVGYDDAGSPVAAATVWSAGEGRPGLLEPVGVHHERRGHGYGTAISLGAAQVLRELGSSSAIVCTPTANEAAVATYRSAGFVPEELRLDAARGAG